MLYEVDGIQSRLELFRVHRRGDLFRRGDDRPARVRHLAAYVAIADDAIWRRGLVVILHMVAAKADAPLAAEFLGRREAERGRGLEDALLGRLIRRDSGSLLFVEALRRLIRL